MNKLVANGFMLLLFIASLFLHNANACASVPEAQKFVENLSKNALEIITSKESNSQKEKKLTDLFVSSVDTKWIARFAIGRYWNDATNEQRTKYVEMHKKFLLNSYIPKFKEYTNQQIKILKASEEGEGEYIVETKIIPADGKEINVSYKVRKGDGGKYMIYDVVAEGVSLITTQRSDFASVLSREGIEALIEKLGAKGTILGG